MTLYDYSIEVIAERADYDRLRQNCSEYHCLHHIYTLNEKLPVSLTLGTRGLEFTLPFVRYDFNKKNVIVRALYLSFICILSHCFVGCMLCTCFRVLIVYV